MTRGGMLFSKGFHNQTKKAIKLLKDMTNIINY